MVTHRRLPRSGWLMLLVVVVTVLTCHGVAAAVAAEHRVGTEVSEPGAGSRMLPPCHTSDDGKRANCGELTYAAHGVGTGPVLPGKPEGVLPHLDVAAAPGVDASTSAERAPPALAELQLLRI